jgi:hypothetical protein
MEVEMGRRAISFCLTLVLVAGVALQASAVVVEVNPSNLNGWTLGTSTGAGPGYAATLVNGPASPPLGTGSARLQVGSDGALGSFGRTNSFNGNLVSAITSLSFSTFVTTNNGGSPMDNQQAPYINILVDLDGDSGSEDQLFFEPAYQTGTYPTVGDPVAAALVGDGAAPKLSLWETYDAMIGGFWTLTSGTFGPPLTTLDDYVTANPNAAINGIRILSGFGGPGDWGNFDGNFDNVTIGISGVDTTFNFEAAPVPEASAMLFGGIACCAGGVTYGIRRFRGKRS